MTQEKGLLATTGSLKAEIIYKPSDIARSTKTAIA